MARLGAGILAGFTGATEFVAHRFWELSGAAEFQARNEFFEHLGLVGGLVMVALLAEERNRRVNEAQGARQSSTSDTAANWRFETEPQTALARIPEPRGKVIGESTRAEGV